MKKTWSSYGNSYLRYLDSLDKPSNSMTMFTLSEQELRLALQDIQEYVIRTSFGKARIEIRHGRIVISTGSLKGTSY